MKCESGIHHFLVILYKIDSIKKKNCVGKKKTKMKRKLTDPKASFCTAVFPLCFRTIAVVNISILTTANTIIRPAIFFFSFIAIELFFYKSAEGM